MNNRQRKTLGWRTPAEAMADETAVFKLTVAIDVLIQDAERIDLGGTSINSEPPKGTKIKTITYGAVIDYLWY
jgi:hypothetical protein